MHGLSDQVELTGSFCMGQCEKGVCVKVDDELFSVTPATAESFFNKEILGRGLIVAVIGFKKAQCRDCHKCVRPLSGESNSEKG